MILYINRWRRCEIFLSLHTRIHPKRVIFLSCSYHRDYLNTNRACSILPWMCIRCGPGILTRRLRLESDARFSWETFSIDTGLVHQKLACGLTLIVGIVNPMFRAWGKV